MKPYYLGSSNITADQYLQAYADNAFCCTGVLGLPRSTSKRYRKQAMDWLAAQKKNKSLESYAKKQNSVKKTTRKQTTRFVITGAVSNSEPHTAFLDALDTYCTRNQAELIIVPIKYKNISLYRPTDETWYAPEVVPFLTHGRIALCDTLHVLDTCIQATSQAPLQRVVGLANGHSCIIPHPSLFSQTVGAPANQLPGIRLTSMACTLPSYSKTQAGQAAAGNHTIGAVVVELSSPELFHVRHIQAAEDGSFYEFDHPTKTFAHFSGDSIQTAQRLEAISYGDLHYDFLDPEVREATWGEDGVTTIGCPREHFLHDAIDFRSRNHHDIGNTLASYKKAKTSGWDVKAELDRLAEFIDSSAFQFGKVNIVASNHDDAICKWLERGMDAENARVWLDLWQMRLDAADAGKDTDPLLLYLRKNCTRKPVSIGRNGAHIIKGVDYGQHGDRGVNGARGHKTLLQTHQTMVIGHTHSPSIHAGRVWVSGHSSLRDMGYNKGYSRWLHTHTIQYPNGKLGQISIVKGAWFA